MIPVVKNIADLQHIACITGDDDRYSILMITKIGGLIHVNTPSGFSKYLVIFVDILGSQSRTKFDEMYQINRIFHEEFENNQKRDVPHTVYRRKIYTFSDCAYIFYYFKDDVSEERKDLGKLFTVALCNCEPMFLKFLSERIIFRGGIYYGDAYIDPNRNMFFGEAVNKAYGLESVTAIHPRIVIDDFVAETVINNINQEIEHYNNVNITSELKYAISTSDFGDGIIEKDEDNRYIYNYLLSPENNVGVPNVYLSPSQFLNELKEYCEQQIDSNNNYKVIDKYHYLLRFLEKRKKFYYQG